MKKLVIILSILLLLSSVSYAGKGPGRGVTRAPVEKEVIEVVKEQPKAQVVVQKEVPRPVQQNIVMPVKEQVVVTPKAVQANTQPDFDELYHDVNCTCALCRWSDSDNYGVKFGGQFLRGLLNATTCWIEIPVKTYDRTVNGEVPFIDTAVGIAEGAGYTVLRAASGVLDVATSWVPVYKNPLIFKSKPTLICQS